MSTMNEISYGDSNALFVEVNARIEKTKMFLFGLTNYSISLASGVVGPISFVHFANALRNFALHNQNSLHHRLSHAVSSRIFAAASLRASNTHTHTHQQPTRETNWLVHIFARVFIHTIFPRYSRRQTHIRYIAFRLSDRCD